MRRTFAVVFGVVALSLIGIATARAQQPCQTAVCSPVFVLQPGALVSNTRTPAVTNLATGQTLSLPRQMGLFLRFTTLVPTKIPRLSLAAVVEWSPNTTTTLNPFTGLTSQQLGVSGIDDNTPWFAYGVSLDVVTAKETGGWGNMPIPGTSSVG